MQLAHALPAVAWMQWVSAASQACQFGTQNQLSSHIHVSLRDNNGKSIFAVSDSELQTGRVDAAYPDTKFLSQEGEWFLAGVLDGLPDSR